MTNREEVERLEDFEEVYRRYFADVYKYVLALSRDEDAVLLWEKSGQ